jgi:hypothetical protein
MQCIKVKTFNHFEPAAFVIVLPDFGLDTAAMVIELDSKLRAK